MCFVYRVFVVPTTVLAQEGESSPLPVLFLTRLVLLHYCYWKERVFYKCGNGVDWDDPIIPDVTRARWETWRTELHVLQLFSILRCFKPDDCGRVVKKELHHFSDASIKGYGQCSYLRLQDDSGRIHCAFVAGKSRVTPSSL